MAVQILPIIAGAGRGLAAAAQGAMRAGAGLVRGAMSAARGAAGAFSRTAAKAPSMAQGAAGMGRYVAGTGGRATASLGPIVSTTSARATAAAQSAHMARAPSNLGRTASTASTSVQQSASQAASQASTSVQQTAQSSIGLVQRAAQNASQTIQQLAQQLSGALGGGGGGGSNQPPSGNAPPAGNQPGGNGQGGRGPVGNFIGNQVRGIARQAVGTAVGTTVAQGMTALRLAMRYSGPMGPFNATKDAATAGTKAVVWLAKLPGRLKDFGDALVKSRDHLNEYNGSLAMAAARLEVERIGRNIRLGAATETTASAQTAAQSRLENAMLPMQALLTNLTNRIVGVLQDGTASVIEGLPTAISFALGASPASAAAWAVFRSKVETYMNAQNAQASLPLQQFAKDLAGGKFMNRHKPPLLPPSFGRPEKGRRS